MKSLTIGTVLVALAFAAVRPAHAQEAVASGSTIVALPPAQTRPAQGVTFLRPPARPPQLRNPAMPSRDALVRYRLPPSETEKKVFAGIFLAFIGVMIVQHKPL